MDFSGKVILEQGLEESDRVHPGHIRLKNFQGERVTTCTTTLSVGVCQACLRTARGYVSRKSRGVIGWES